MNPSQHQVIGPLLPGLPVIQCVDDELVVTPAESLLPLAQRFLKNHRLAWAGKLPAVFSQSLALRL